VGMDSDCVWGLEWGDLGGMSENDEAGAVGVTPKRIMEVGMGFWGSKALLSAVEMEVFTELARHPEGLEALRGRLGLHPRGAQDFFDALVSMGFLERSEEGIYSNAPDAAQFLDNIKKTLERPDSIE
jgi:hypothetical protein